MTWQPGQRVFTPEDRAAWEQWRRDRKREQQRMRRATNPRIDFYPSPAVQKIVDPLRRPYVGGDVSSVLNRIVIEWAEARGLVPPELKAGR